MDRYCCGVGFLKMLKQVQFYITLKWFTSKLLSFVKMCHKCIARPKSNEAQTIHRLKIKTTKLT